MSSCIYGSHLASMIEAFAPVGKCIPFEGETSICFDEESRPFHRISLPGVEVWISPCQCDANMAMRTTNVYERYTVLQHYV